MNPTTLSSLNKLGIAAVGSRRLAGGLTNGIGSDIENTLLLTTDESDPFEVDSGPEQHVVDLTGFTPEFFESDVGGFDLSWGSDNTEAFVGGFDLIDQLDMFKQVDGIYTIER